MQAIYKITNTKTDDYYIGSSVNFTYRKWVHIKQLRENKHPNPFLQNSWNKNGEGAFIFEVIEEVEKKEDLVPREQYYLDTLKPRYNLCKVAGSPLGYKHTCEARANMSKAHVGKSLKEMGHKIGCICAVCVTKKGETHPNFGKPRSLETRVKLGKVVLQYDLDGTFISEWIGASEAARVLSINQSHISACCRQAYGRKSYKGFIWKYKN